MLSGREARNGLRRGTAFVQANQGGAPPMQTDGQAGGQR